MRVNARVDSGSDREGAGSVGVVRTQSLRLDLPVGGLELESGQRLTEVDVAYETYGSLSAARDNAVFICHALSGNAHAAGRHEPADPDEPGAWWDAMIGPGKGIDTRHYFVVCANILGGCKGTTGPASTNTATGKPYGAAFPPITVGDMVVVHRLLLLQLGVTRLAAVVGGSLGGMQVLDWAVRFPEMMDRCIVIASSGGLSAEALAFDIVGRKAIQFDPDWQGGDFYGTGRKPDKGLSLARKLGHITYLSREMMAEKFGRERWTTEALAAGEGDEGLWQSRLNKFQVQTYLEHQGEKFTRRFDANSYLVITRAMDEYDLASGEGGLAGALSRIQAKMLMVAVSSDWLFPPRQSTVLANEMLRAGKQVTYCLLTSEHGHDAFLVDVQHLSQVISAFMPWVGAGRGAGDDGGGGARPRQERGGPSHRMSRETVERAHVDREYAAIVRMVSPGSRILDVGCGSGNLLALLAERKGTQGMGVEIDVGHVIDVIEKGYEIFQADIDAGLAMVPNGAYDYAMLSETLQVVRRPREVLLEILRVAREGIVSFPNFGNWRHRASLWLRGRMPRGGALPYAWHETPNIHLFTYRDFLDLCASEQIDVLETVPLAETALGRLAVGVGAVNLGADSVLVRISRRGAAATHGKAGTA